MESETTLCMYAEVETTLPLLIYSPPLHAPDVSFGNKTRNPSGHCYSESQLLSLQKLCCISNPGGGICAWVKEFENSNKLIWH